MWGAAYLFMIGPPERRPAVFRALGVAVVSCLVFGAAFVAFAALLLGDHEGLAWLFGVPAVLGWEALTALAARRLAPRA